MSPNSPTIPEIELVKKFEIGAKQVSTPRNMCKAYLKRSYHDEPEKAEVGGRRYKDGADRGHHTENEERPSCSVVRAYPTHR